MLLVLLMFSTVVLCCGIRGGSAYTCSTSAYRSPSHHRSHRNLKHVLTPPLVGQINDVEKGYYADGEDAYDMRLPFIQNESSSGIKPMTPLKQVVAVNAKRKEEGAGTPAPDGEAKGKGGGGGKETAAAAAAAAGADGSEEIATKLEGLSLEANQA